MARETRHKAGRVPLQRALSKAGILSRAQAKAAILAGRVRIDGTIAYDPSLPVVPERVEILLDGELRQRAPWRTVVLHKPRGVVCSHSDPEGRPTVFDILGGQAGNLRSVGRLDMASTGLLILTTDNRLANWLTDPASDVPRVYAVTVRGRATEDETARLLHGLHDRGEELRASAVTIRRASARESHLIVELREGRNREVRRLFVAIGHEVIRLKRVSFGPLALGNIAPGEWRELSRADVENAFPKAPRPTRARPRR